MAYFDTFSYTSDAGKIYNIRMDADGAGSITGNDLIGGTISDGNVKVSVAHHGQKRRTGIKARGFVIGVKATAPARGYTTKTFVPILSPTVYNSYQRGATITYKGTATWEVIDKVAEV